MASLGSGKQSMVSGDSFRPVASRYGAQLSGQNLVQEAFRNGPEHRPQVYSYPLPTITPPTPQIYASHRGSAPISIPSPEVAPIALNRVSTTHHQPIIHPIGIQGVNGVTLQATTYLALAGDDVTLWSVLEI